MSAALPLSSIRISPVLPEGQPQVSLAQRPFLDIEAVTPQWFDTMRVAMRAGRVFTDADTAAAPKVIIVNETFARRFWPGQNAIGRRVIVGRGPGPSEVVGVAADVRNRGLAESPEAQLWLPFRQLPWGNMNLLVRTTVPPLSLANAVRAQVAAIDPDEPVTGIQTVDDLMDASRAQPRFVMLLLGIFSATAFGLAAIGLYGVLTYAVAQRRRELAIRIALGAGKDNILGMVLRQGVLLAATGIVIGLAAAAFLTGLMKSLLFETGALDVTTFVLAPIAFLTIALLASYVPARRATKVDPMDALRV
jgi:putative ABC transport system permease protein